jgi:Raf kinase inhibitor-like YbhB/YbcL family protein
MKFEITSDAFDPGQVIPKKYTCDGQDISPPLQWSGAPNQTQSFALMMEDPDAPSGTFDHWVLFNIPAATTKLPEAMPSSAVLTNGAKQGINGFGRLGYGGPCPPQGDDSHRYFFRLYALDVVISALEGTSKNEVKRAMEGHVLAEAALIGTYARRKAAGGKTSGA